MKEKEEKVENSNRIVDHLTDDDKKVLKNISKSYHRRRYIPIIVIVVIIIILVFIVNIGIPVDQLLNDGRAELVTYKINNEIVSDEFKDMIITNQEELDKFKEHYTFNERINFEKYNLIVASFKVRGDLTNIRKITVNGPNISIRIGYNGECDKENDYTYLVRITKEETPKNAVVIHNYVTENEVDCVAIGFDFDEEQISTS